MDKLTQTLPWTNFCCPHSKKPTLADEIDIHGLRDVFSPSRKLSIFWCVILVVFAGFYGGFLYQNFSNMVSQPLKTSIAIRSEKSMMYPTLNFCPASYLDSAKVDAHPELKWLDDFLPNGLAGYSPRGYSNRSYNLTSVRKVTMADFKRRLTDLSLGPKEFVLACDNSMSRPCRISIVPVLSMRHGLCYVVRAADQQIYPEFGLRMILNANINPIRRSSTNAVQLALLYGERLVEMGGQVALEPGRYMRLSLRRTKVQYVDCPWGEKPQRCVTETHSGDIAKGFFVLRNVSYTSYSCGTDCYSHAMHKLFGCLRPTDPSVLRDSYHNATVCSIEQVNAFFDTVEKAVTAGDCIGKCMIPSCSEDRVSVTENSVVLHSIPTYPVFENQWRSINISHSLQSVILVDIAFPALEYTIIEQSYMKSVPEIVAEIGGQTGLWLGGSMVTIVQVIVVVYKSICKRLMTSKRKVSESFVRTV